MTANEKITIARLLDLTEDYIKTGYAKTREYQPVESESEAAPEPESAFSSLPLAYQIDDNDVDEHETNEQDEELAEAAEPASESE
jgi:hypothetical protein